MNREFKSNIWILLLFTSLTLFGSKASAVTFNVSNSDELQAPLTTAAGNGGDNEIIPEPGIYPGNFTYRAVGDHALRVAGDSSASRDQVSWTVNQGHLY